MTSQHRESNIDVYVIKISRECDDYYELDGRVLKVTKSVQIDEKPVKSPTSAGTTTRPLQLRY